MGIPSFFRWLLERYPKIVVDVIEEEAQEVNGVVVPVDTTAKNPNSVEFDNFYLDMNGIIHPCCHPEGKEAPPTEEDMLIEIGKYLDRLFAIVRPRKFLYMAIDGPAPRAKLNQQRSRRFKAAKEAEQKAIIQAKMLETGIDVPEANAPKFDTNCITPGTPFMAKVTNYLRYYIADHLNSDPGWKGLNVILSDSNVPGEGEHKLMEFIRKQRSDPTWNPNTRHVLYGLDADLIMLALSTHEPHFSILREIMVTSNLNTCYRCGQKGHIASECEGQVNTETPKKQEYQFLRVSVLREYLHNTLYVENLPFEFDLERAIDDWVFINFFVGNDFLPHLPSLQIREDAIGLLTRLYKKILPTTGYLTNSGDIDVNKVILLVSELAPLEDHILKNRIANEERKKQRMRESKEREAQRDSRKRTAQSLESERTTNRQKNFDAAAALRASLMGSTESSGDSTNSSPPTKKIRTSLESSSDSTPLDRSVDSLTDDAELPDEIRLGEEGWKARYYKTKFGVTEENEDFFESIRTEYFKGLSWVLQYYYRGCPSWEWFYPFHFAPFASDLAKTKDISLTFKLGVPLKPVEQLMAVLPPFSALHLPEHYRQLVTDPQSPLADLYPTQFKLDFEPGQPSYKAVALLPFIDSARLLEATAPLEETLTEEEAKRNSVHLDEVYIDLSHPLAPVLQEAHESNGWMKLEPQTAGLAGKIRFYEGCHFPGETFPSTIPSILPPIEHCNMYSVQFVLHGDEIIIKRGLLPGVTLPLPVLSSEDMAPTRSHNRGYYRNQNSAANRVINHSLGPNNQYKMNHNQQERANHQHYSPYGPASYHQRRDNDRSYDDRREGDRSYDDRRDTHRRPDSRQNYSSRDNRTEHNTYGRDNRGRDNDRGYGGEQSYSRADSNYSYQPPNLPYAPRDNRNQQYTSYDQRQLPVPPFVQLQLPLPVPPVPITPNFMPSFVMPAQQPPYPLAQILPPPLPVVLTKPSRDPRLANRDKTK